MSYVGVPPFGQTVRTISEKVAVQDQVDFYPDGGYLPGYIDVIANGSELLSTDFTALDGVKVTLKNKRGALDEIRMIAYWPVSLVDTYRKTEVDAIAALKLSKAGDSMTGSLGTKALLETATITAAAPAATTQFDVATQAVQFYTTNAANNFTLNLRASSSASLDSILAIGQSVTVALMVTNGATPYYLTALTIDGAAVTPKWQGGSAPTSGNASSIDVYSVTVVKTAAATFTAFASQTQFK